MLFSQDQRFTCARCGRCCRRTTVPITAGEAAAYRKAGAASWFREGVDDTSVSTRDPFELIPGHAPLLRIRKRPDGACGFLSPEGLCRIHERLGADRKPLACRLFPLSGISERGLKSSKPKSPRRKSRRCRFGHCRRR